MSGRMKEWYRSKKLLENKVGFVSKTEFRVWPQNRASAFSRPNPQGLNHDMDNWTMSNCPYGTNTFQGASLRQPISWILAFCQISLWTDLRLVSLHVFAIAKRAHGYSTQQLATAVLNNLSGSLKLVSRTTSHHHHHCHRCDFVETGNHLFFWWKTWMTLTLRKWHWHRAATLETDQGETGRGDWGRHARRRPSSHPKGNIENNIQTRLN